MSELREPGLPFDTLDEVPVKQIAWAPADKARAFRERFWPLWPRKVAKAAAEKAWMKAAKSPRIADEIVAGAEAQLHKLTEDLQFCPHPATWLNQGRWEDEVESLDLPIEQPEFRQEYRMPPKTKCSQCGDTGMRVEKREAYGEVYDFAVPCKHLVKCPDCNGVGAPWNNSASVPCKRCGGTGKIHGHLPDTTKGMTKT